MKDRTAPCIYYVCAHAPCQKQVKDVTLSKCKNCKKYRPRKTAKREETARSKRERDKDRHDNWKKNW